MSSLSTQASFQCTVTTCGNPDFGQPRNWGRPSEMFISNSIDGLREMIQAFIRTEELGAGNTYPMDIYYVHAVDEGYATRQLIGQLAYNGRFIQRDDVVEEIQQWIESIRNTLDVVGNGACPHENHRVRSIHTSRLTMAQMELQLMQGTMVLRRII